MVIALDSFILTFPCQILYHYQHVVQVMYTLSIVQVGMALFLLALPLFNTYAFAGKFKVLWDKLLA